MDEEAGNTFQQIVGHFLLGRGGSSWSSESVADSADDDLFGSSFDDNGECDAFGKAEISNAAVESKWLWKCCWAVCDIDRP